MADSALWAAVVSQALVDLEEEPYESAEYAQAAAFFLHGGAWAASRESVADCLPLHADDLRRIGQRTIAKREAVDGGAPEPAPVVRRRAADPPPAPPPIARAVRPPPLFRPVAARIPKPVKPPPGAPRYLSQPSNAWLIKLLAE